jgi:hypothetical protein
MAGDTLLGWLAVAGTIARRRRRWSTLIAFWCEAVQRPRTID